MKKFENTIVKANALEIVKSFEQESIDLAISEPPYDENTSRNKDHAKFSIEDNILFAKRLLPKLKKGACFILSTGQDRRNWGETMSAFKKAIAIEKLGYKLFDTMIFKKINWRPFSKPESNRKGYNSCFKYIFVFTKGKIKTFNHYKTVKTATGKTVSDCNVWEYEQKADDIYSEEHPGSLPYKLLEDLICSFSNEGDFVCDFFCGSGTALKAAKQNDRKYFGSELNEEFVRISKLRLSGKRLTL